MVHPLHPTQLPLSRRATSAIQPATLIRRETLTHISEPLNSELFCSFSWDSVKSSALFASFFWKSFRESRFFFEGLPLAGPVLSLGKTPGIFPGGQASGRSGRPGREAALAAHTCHKNTQKTPHESPFTFGPPSAQRALRHTAAPETPPPPLVLPPSLPPSSRLRRPHAPARL